MDKVVLAYSGGLDTTYCAIYLNEYSKTYIELHMTHQIAEIIQYEASVIIFPCFSDQSFISRKKSKFDSSR